MLYVFSQYYTLTFEILAVKCCYGVEVNWSRYRDTGVTDPALIVTLYYIHVLFPFWGK